MSAKITSTCLKVSYIIAFMLFFQVSKAQLNFTELSAKLEASKAELGGKAVLLVYKDGKIVFEKSVGEFTPKTQAPIAASTQWLTAALVMSYVDEGKLSLDDKVSKFLPIFSKYSKGYITIRDCLTHLTGIEGPSIGSLKDMSNPKKFSSLDEIVNDIASSKEILSNPGLVFRFNNIGYTIVARVLEVLNRRGFEQMMAERITRPLLMRTTNFFSYTVINPAGGAQSSAYDYMNFLSMLLNGGVFNGKRILSEAAIETMSKASSTQGMVKESPAILQGKNYAMGQWILGTDENGKTTTVVCPGLFGTWPLIDYCRKYTFLVFTPGDASSEKKELMASFKTIIDNQIVSSCQ
ncbi:MAG: serine hydrolase domain-containing protein [Bacteroidota bacterium]